MKILSLDTATRMGSIALVDEDQLLGEIQFNTEITHTERLLPGIENLLQKTGCHLKDLDGLACTIGPGSFTGLRIGLATLKGFAQVYKLPIVGVSSLLTLAHNGILSELPIVSLLDAKRGEVYAAAYQFKQGILKETLIPEQAVKPEILCDTLSKLGPCWLLGDGAYVYRELFTDRLQSNVIYPPEFLMRIHAKWIAWLALPRFKKGEGKDWQRLTPNYLRPSDAELKK
ncbi:MAG: tRNA (adenosine(37)-N6)-threonylcarbamoyltransferase complex dimerization subunit type 1 TsaB [Deltaproteobacteria bacterium RIFCSPLOWO2_12_FULL_44_12]|nr:MAG: tRNA (adenosine(37)-N6)-threonylcarbamoyltransferase complex dimerization subunit type 1 TsaB [Deltaproteobacteria bacterium RIFCSPHIGHO2_01_FULL_43_49]OGQ15574.1 MAG: tRNA (adenosine(37)-N6)-threonylcarbamoyltransferase complex dimerization subunit type 1 TsaB [Deltaproteobacteria bacterium RIFCSPHIGHO2_02_FULL_44_53]OGQ29708.1 MAG: tRNA (adenosine(37)-N6)-threonylcarbamoyltransferase complex dimerization subunit type 1 TsaB [Deltaproteobacteria bacterium RIFCSPHIGHO2_12_FULL_44_21]OGQ3